MNDITKKKTGIPILSYLLFLSIENHITSFLIICTLIKNSVHSGKSNDSQCPFLLS